MPEAEIRSMVATGMTRREIAATIGCSLSTINKYLARIGLKTLGRHRPSPFRKPPGHKRARNSRVYSRPRVAKAGTAANPFGLRL